MIRILRILPTHTGIGHVAGAWATLAQDLRNGVFYRPLDGPLGYGGTRYMPLHFVLHSILIRLTGEPIWSGLILSFISFATLLAAVLLWMRRLGVEKWTALIASGLILAMAPIQLSLTSIRGDMLAAALNLWGLAFCAALDRGDSDRRPVIGAALAFSLAFLTKLTTLFGAAAAILVLLLKPQRRRMGWALVALTLLLAATGTGLTLWLSHGKFWESMRACATGGQPAIRWMRFGIGRALQHDPVGVLVITLALATMLSTPRIRVPRLPLAAYVFTGLGTGILFLSPGTDWNHLIDLDMCSLVLLVSLMGRAAAPPTWGRSLLTVLMLVAIADVAAIGPVSNAPSDRRAREETVRAIRESSSRGVVLVENVGMAIEAGQRPYLMDPFALRLTRRWDPAIDADFRGKMEGTYFKAIILFKDAFRDSSAAEWYNDWHLGPGFLRLLKAHYRQDDRYSLSHVYVPRQK